MLVEDIAKRLFEETALAKIVPPMLKNANWRRAIKNWAKMYGYKDIGWGYFGVVYYNEKRPKEVVKVFSDTSYLEWVKIAKNNSSNPYMPKFKGTPIRLYKGKDLWMIRLEKLTPISPNYTPGQLNWLEINEFATKYLEDNYGVPDRSSKYVTVNLKKPLYNPIWKDDNLMEIMDSLGVFLTYHDNQSKYKLDLHNNNFMLRGSQLVFIDPFAEI